MPIDLATIEEIRQVKYRYLRCVDLKLWDELAEVFTPDATVDYGTQVYGKPLKLAGRDEIVGFLRDKLGPDMITVHRAGQPEITVDGDTAQGTWSFEDTVIATAVPGRDHGRGLLPGPVRARRGRPVADRAYRLRAHLRGDDVAGRPAELQDHRQAGDGWRLLTQAFAEALAEAEKLIAGAPFVASEQDLAEGYDYLAGSIQASLRLAWAYQRDFPYFVPSTGPYTKMGLDNPDTLYFHAYLRDDAEYVVTGRRGSTADLSFQVLKGDYSPVEVPDSLSAFDDRAIEVDADGTFELRFGPSGRRAELLHARRRVVDAAGPRGVQRLGRRTARHDQHPPRRTGPARAAGRRHRTRWPSATAWPARSCCPGCARSCAFPEWFYLKLAGQHDDAAAADAGRAGHPVLLGRPLRPGRGPGDDRDGARGRRDVAPYQGIQLGSMWYVSLDYINHQTSLTADQARIDPDRRLRFVISERDPGVANWLELTGRRRGYVQIRWQRLTRDLTEEDGPSVEVVPFDRIAERLAYYDHAKVSPPQWRDRIAARQAAVAERMLG